MRAYEGYFENGQFFSLGQKVLIPDRRKVILNVLDEPAQEAGESEYAGAWREFFEAINASDEEVPEFERARFKRKDNNSQLAAFDAFIAEIHDSGEEVPEFERAKLGRETDL